MTQQDSWAVRVLRTLLHAVLIVAGLLVAASTLGVGALYLFAPAEYYSYHYGVPTTNVIYEKEPHDCEFNVPPLGKKYCHYEKSVLVHQGDDGQKYVYVTWSKVQE